MGIFGFLAGPLGWLLRVVYGWVNNYFLAIFLFTLLTRLILFPLSLQSQKKQADRIRLAPRLERLQKKYKNDPRKLQEKQQALYEKEGVSLTGGCLPMIVQMVVLFGIIAVIYKPLTYLSTVDKNAVSTAISAVNVETYMTVEKNKKVPQPGYTLNADGTQAFYSKDGVEYTVDLTTKQPANDVTEKNYYSEMNMMKVLEENEADIIRAFQTELNYDEAQAKKSYASIAAMKEQFSFGSYSLLDNPWNKEKGFGGINLLWLIPLLSGLTAVISTLISMHYSKQGMSQENVPGQGCSNSMMYLFMPLFSLYITFTVPGGVGIYWTCSNVIAIVQTVVQNMIYNPKKIREQAERDYEERRRLRAEMKKKQQTLADARRLDDEAERAADEAAARAAEEAKNPANKGKKKEKKLNLEVGEIKKDKEKD